MRKQKKQRQSKPYLEDRPSREVSADKETGRNDVSWYTRYPNLSLAAGSFPYPYRPGMVLPFNDNASAQIPAAIPGVMSLKWAPTIGKSAVATDPASILGMEMYARVRKAYSGRIYCDAPDFVMYVMALDSVFSYIAMLKRMYRAVVAWNPENYAIPDSLTLAIMPERANQKPDLADVNTLRMNRTRLWQIINELVLMSRKFSCPASMDIFNRHYWMNDNVYMDANMVNSQLYVFKQVYFYKYTEQSTPDDVLASGLALTEYTSGSLSHPDGLYAFGKSLIDALAAWEDAYTISGYLARAYEGVPQFQVEELAQDATLELIYNEEVLMQIENSRSIAYGYRNDAFTITNPVSQDPKTNAVLSNPIATYNLNNDAITRRDYAMLPLLSIRSSSPTVAQSIVASRLLATLTVNSTSTSGEIMNIRCGTEIPIDWVFYGKMWNASKSKLDDLQGSIPPTFRLSTGVQSQDELNSMTAWLLMSQFDWAPIGFYSYALSITGGSTTEFYLPRGDIHNATVIQQEDLDNLHKICLYSEFSSFSQ